MNFAGLRGSEQLTRMLSPGVAGLQDYIRSMRLLQNTSRCAACRTSLCNCIPRW